jgi:hypothetical protein
MADNKLYALFDCAMQGMSDNGLLGVFDTKEKAEEAKGTNWYSIKEFDVNKIYDKGVECSH